MVRPATRKTNTAAKAAKVPDKPSPVSNILKIGSLKRFPDKDYANQLLHDVAKSVAPIIHENNFKVGNLCEMFPKNPNLLGLNVNRGQKILIRLRYHSNDRSFYPLGDIVETFLHELTHNLHGAHDEKFYKFLDGLKKRFEEIQYGGMISKTGYRCEENTLGGGYNPEAGYVSVREKRIKQLSKHKFVPESKKLGSDGRISKPLNPQNIRAAMLEAAERRAKDSKWCHSNNREVSAEPDSDELEIIDVDTAGSVTKKDTKFAEYKEVIDLTSEGCGDSITCDNELIVIDACEEEPKEKSKNPRKVRFSGLLPPFDDEDNLSSSSSKIEADEDKIQYTASSSPRAFFGDENKYPRRKLVADLNFDQIIKKGKRITVNIDSSSNEQKKNLPKRAKKSKKGGVSSEMKEISRPKKSTESAKQPKKKKAPAAQRSTTTRATHVKKTVKNISFNDLL